MDQRNYGSRVPRRTGADPQLPGYMSASTRAAGGAAKAGTTVRSTQRPATARKGPSGGGGSNAGGGGGNRTRKRKPSRAQRLLRFALLILAVLLLVIGGILLAMRFGGDGEVNAAVLENKTYLEGVSVHGVDVTDKTIEQARGILQSVVTKELSGISITMTEDTGSWAFTSADMNISSNMEDALLEAMKFGREGSLGERAEQKDELEQSGKDFRIMFTPNRNGLINKLNSIAGEVNRAAIEPHMTGALDEENNPVFDLQPGENGRVLNTEATADAIIALVEAGDYQASVEAVYDILTPTVDAAAIQENTKFRASYTTTFSNSSSGVIPNRVFNIEKAASIINGCVVQPGESWSFNGYVGLRTVEGGWKEANGISGGKEYTLQAGGGICQVSTTLYNALLSGNVQIDYRKKHSIPSDYVSYGLDCTVDSSGIDLNFTNSTNAPLYLFVYTHKNKDSSRRKDITVLLYGEPLPEGVTYKTRSEILEEAPRDDTVYVDDPTIPYGYMLTKVVAHPRIVAEAYQDKYVNGERVDSKLLNTDTYKGNPPEMHIGTGDPASVPVPEGAVPATVQPQEPVPDTYRIAAAMAAAGSDAGATDEGEEAA